MQPALKQPQADFGGNLVLNAPNQTVGSLGQNLDLLWIWHSQICTCPIGGGRRMRVRGQQDDLVRLKSAPIEFLADHVGKFVAHDHQIEAENQTAGIAAFQQESGDLDRIEDLRCRRLARRVTSEADLSLSRGYIA